jgi:hypothetical protein
VSSATLFTTFSRRLLGITRTDLRMFREKNPPRSLVITNAGLASIEQFDLADDLTRQHAVLPIEIVSQITLLRRLPAIFAGVGYLITAPPSAVIGD